MSAPRMIPFLVVLMSVLTQAQTGAVTEVSATSASVTSGNVLKTTICEVIANPVSFDGKMIELRADVLGGLESNALYDKNCGSKKKSAPSILLVESTDVTWKNRPKEYKKFWRLVGAYREPKGRRHSIVPDKYTVTATVTGHFDAVTASHAGGQLALKSVRDVVARQQDDGFKSGVEAETPFPEKKKPH